MMPARPSLILMLAIAAGATSVTHGVSAATAEAEKAPVEKKEAEETRLGNSLKRDIAQRDKADSARARQLDMREQVVKAAEKRLEDGLGKADEPSARGGKAEKAPDEFDRLAKIFQAMKPRRAAVVFEELVLDVQLQVARRMRERQTAQIMANMTPSGAAKLSMALASVQSEEN